jgi:hypothetical protein
VYTQLFKQKREAIEYKHPTLLAPADCAGRQLAKLVGNIDPLLRTGVRHHHVASGLFSIPRSHKDTKVRED